MTKRKGQTTTMEVLSKEQYRHEFTRVVSYSEKDKFQFASDVGVQDIKVVLSCTHGKFPTTQPRKTREALNALLGNDAKIEIYQTRQGNLMVAISDPTHVPALLEASHLGDIPITSRIIEDTICTKFVLKNVDVDLSLDDIASELTAQGIYWIQLVRFTKPNSSDKVPVVLVKELGKTDRHFLYVCSQHFRVEPFKESPKICKKCLRFNHYQTHCQLEPRCSACGGSHVLQECLSDSPKCFRCGESHYADYKKCSKVLAVDKGLALAQQSDSVQSDLKLEEKIRSLTQKVAVLKQSQEDISALTDLVQQQTETIAALIQEVEMLQQSNADLSRQVTELNDEYNQHKPWWEDGNRCL